MKRLVISILVVFLLCISCGPAEKGVTFKVLGTDGLAFSGCYGNISSDKSVDGTVPAEYYTTLEDEFDVVACVFQKDEEYGILTVELYVMGDLKERESTSAAYGIVSLSYSE